MGVGCGAMLGLGMNALQQLVIRSINCDEKGEMRGEMCGG